MSLMPVPESDVPIVWQNSVVDIEPTSRYGPRGTPDIASITTVMLLDNPKQGPVSFMTPGHWETDVLAESPDASDVQVPERVTSDDAAFVQLRERFESFRSRTSGSQERIAEMLGKIKRFHRFSLELEEGHRLVRFTSKLPLIEEDDGSYKFSAICPVEFTTFAKGGDYSAIVLLPRSARYPDGPNYEVKLLDFSREPQPQVLGGDDGGRVGERTTVAWYWRADPTHIVQYLYEKIST
ncbi:MAG TPA: hypothetical protein VNE62_04070 [Actinomycetota bacterium]|nr:hypothetical protein [Actinomycetota bacterium]